MADTSQPQSHVATPEASDLSGKKSRQENASRQSGRVTFPNSAKSGSSAHSMRTDEIVPKGNPFKMPPDSDIFLLRDKERQRKKQERLRQRNLKVHEKTTYASRVNFRTAAMIHPAESESEEEEDTDKAVAVKDDPQFTIAVTRDRHVEKESLAEYIAKKREMFLVQYSLGVKRDEMRKLEEIAQAEEKKLELAEQYLEEDAAMFDEFLKENDKNSVEAIKIAEAEAKQKMEKINEIKRINAQMMGIKSEISKYEDTLKEYQLYRGFLESLIPQEVQEERQKALEKRREEKSQTKETAAPTSKSGSRSDASEKGSINSGRRPTKKTGGKGEKGTTSPSKSPSSQSEKTIDAKMDDLFIELNTLSSTQQAMAMDEIKTKQEDSETGEPKPELLDMEDSDEELDLFFTDPQQLLDIFAELEEQNLSLIQNSQETEEALEEMKHTIKQTKVKMEKETKTLKEQIDKLQSQIQSEEAKAADLKIKAKMFNYGEFKADDDQEQHLSELNKKVEDVYRNCIGDNEANISTLQMLTNIENRLEELFEMIETMPQDKVEAAEKAKDKERRLKMREEKMEQLRIHQEERVRRALERAKAEPKKQTGKRLVFRSKPPELKKKEDEGADQASREEEELQYYFAW
ncbi:cilia- and flagella-associated protein 100 isoform X1 [Aplysia californica]|uniref:Cilia- and flagella-associated protein 100 isoform X1 n=1 Tax=Aplysia californica TaxID=6500 RepID=A0ABM0K3U4_APLCA|nr:cilia- and flagella-associated protein 100 isoform X1 [Aplysia californica]